jgi:hypothetical protein
MRNLLTTFTTMLVVSTLMLLTFWPDLVEYLVVFAYLVKYVWMVGLGVWLAMLMMALLSSKELRATALKCALVIALTAAFVLTKGPQIGEQVRFRLVSGNYEKQLAAILRARAEARPIEKKEFPDLAEIEEGPVPRVAFYWQRGMIDNWVGLIYDPTGEVMKANAFKADWSNWEAPELQKVKRLFGGSLFSARHLTGHWYLCSFT